MNTKELILAKTLKLMFEKQNSLVSIREISDISGIAIGGIYHYFSSKEKIYNEITERYLINYIKFDMDKLKQIKGNAKEKIHDALAEMFKEKQSGIEIETIDNVDYRIIVDVLTANVLAYENSHEIYRNVLKELMELFTEITVEGQNNREIRQDLPAKDIAESLIRIYLGIQYKWEVYWIDDMVSSFEDNFDLEWEKIRFKE
ncbi:TetR/AcrR family transcriptional regulator [Methanobrevibacter sp.]|uniref:TetR/AcrR family transcriptional regulator n=1 Tax=Methanobrevibacter sp. TaxID=66852 RepID=UPI00388F458C